MDDELGFGQSETQQSKRLKSALFGNRPPKKAPDHSSSPIGQLFSIKREHKAAEFRTPSKSSFAIGNFITTKSPEHITEGIDASDSDDDFGSEFQTRDPVKKGQSVATIQNLPDIEERQMQPHNEANIGEEKEENLLRQTSKQDQLQNANKESFFNKTPLIRNKADSNLGANFKGKEGTPISAQRNFLSSHLKSSMLNTIPSSARRLDNKKGMCSAHVSFLDMHIAVHIQSHLEFQACCGKVRSLPKDGDGD